MHAAKLMLTCTLLASTVHAADADIKVWIDAGRGGIAKESINKQTVVGGWLQDPGKAHWQNFMVSEFLNHDPDEPRVGAQALVDLMRSGPSAATLATVVSPGAKAKPRFFVIADGDYVAIAHNPANFDMNKPTPGVDPGAHLGGNVFHVVNGKITEWWYYANGSGPNAAGSDQQPGGTQIDISANSMRPDAFGNTPIIYGTGKPVDKDEARNKKLVLAWLKEFWVQQKYGAWSKYMSAEFRNHDVRQPALGAQALADWLLTHPEFKSDYALSKGVAHAQLFLLAEGDLVFVLGSPEVNNSFDPQAQIGAMSGNVLRIENHKIVESWHIGNNQHNRVAVTPATGAAR
ncbi:MAG: hypothetical protein QM808_05405 [Steroidobacteraceae bacterium]